MKASAIIRDITENDLGDWRRLYNGYGDFYNLAVTDDTAETVWSWLHDSAHPVCGVMAFDENNNAIGLAHYRDMPSPLRGAVVGFLDDLYVDPNHRGSGSADALLAHIADIGKSRGWPFYSWKTADDNYRGRGFYDRVSNKTHWVMYQYDIE